MYTSCKYYAYRCVWTYVLYCVEWVNRARTSRRDIMANYVYDSRSTTALAFGKRTRERLSRAVLEGNNNYIFVVTRHRGLTPRPDNRVLAPSDVAVINRITTVRRAPLPRRRRRRRDSSSRIVLSPPSVAYTIITTWSLAAAVFLPTSSESTRLRYRRKRVFECPRRLLDSFLLVFLWFSFAISPRTYINAKKK